MPGELTPIFTGFRLDQNDVFAVSPQHKALEKTAKRGYRILAARRSFAATGMCQWLSPTFVRKQAPPLRR